MDKRTSTAYHEAGHAVIGHILGITVTRVVLNSDGTGTCFGDRPKGWTVRNELHYTLAGPVCHAVVSRVSMYDILAHIVGEAGDGIVILNCAVEILPTPRTRPYTVVKQHAKIVRQMVIENSSAIEGLAMALLDRGELSGNELAKFLEERKQ